ncbi:hypothetical protein KL86DES1_20282 [uncultured Desulfovibrio sp.]|uniref:Uncharacterized protein n=1 Tax=uncultured Desulfovibrio sp. TaxID=167968 RepID=A0A212L2Z5_9BACT|nr:hypothetical protein KL86DES1_20282 [uncultured Desulfovibrio sp.]
MPSLRLVMFCKKLCWECCVLTIHTVCHIPLGSKTKKEGRHDPLSQ